MSTWPARVLAGALAGGLLGFGAVPTPVAAVDVVVEEDRYVGTYAIVTPGAVDDTSRRQLSECDDCAWRFAAPCRVESGGNGCTSVVRGCPAGRELLRLWFTQRGQDWEDRGLVCLLESDIVPVARVGTDVRDRFERRVPGQDPSCEPGAGAVTQVPLVCTSGQGGATPVWNDSLLGLDVRIQTSPAWTWDFDAGVRLVTNVPGGTYPDMSVSHTYRTPGARVIRVTTEWRGSYTADGLGPFPLPTIRQVTDLPIVIGQARAILTRPEARRP